MEIVLTRLEKEICDALTERNISYEFQSGGFTVYGFYKSGIITLQTNKEGTLTATSRYSKETEIRCFDDLVRLNYDWWDSSRHRFDGWKTPEEGWKADLLRLRLAKVKTTEIWE